MVSTKSQIPTRPGLVPVEFNTPQPVANIEHAPAPETMFVPPESESAEEFSSLSSVNASPSVKAAVATAAKVPPSTVAEMPLNTQGLPDAWIVQVGSFSTKEAANKICDDLQADGLKAYVRTVPNGSASISRVFIGPKLDKAQALAIKAQIDKRFKVNAMVKHFQP